MKRFNHIVVCVDHSDYDAPMLVYAGGRSRVAESAEVHFLHVVDDAGPVDDEAAAAPGLTRETLQALAAEHFKGHGRERLVCEVLRGSPLVETLRYALEKDIDLIMLGRHHGQQREPGDTALLARRLSRKATCSVLVLPEEYRFQADRLVVPVRDSECSAGALEVACGVAAYTGAAVTALNIYRVGSGYARTGVTLEEHQALLEKAGERECAKLLEKTDTHGLTVECKCMPDLQGDPVPIILEMLGDGLGQAVVIGARGRTGAAGVLLGTVTEQLIRKSPSPVLAVKKKGECLGLLRALLVCTGQET